MKTERAERVLSDSELRCYWTDATPFPEPSAPASGRVDCDLAIVGAGYTGLWAALEASARDPDRHIVVLEAEQAGFGASTRNGGFVDASLTHGLAHGATRFPAELDRLLALGRDNWDGWRADLDAHAIDAQFEQVGQLGVATEPWQVGELREASSLLRRHGEVVVDLDADEVRAEVDSPTFLAGIWQQSHEGLVDPARLVFGLRDAVQRAGVVLHDGSPVTELGRDRAAVRLTGTWGTVRAAKVVLATNAFPPLTRRIHRTVVPVYDYVLVTEPLAPDRLRAIGWANHQGLSDAGNQFHYFRLVDGDRLLWGGYDAVYHYGSRVDASLEDRPATYELLARQLLATFPQLDGRTLLPPVGRSDRHVDPVRGELRDAARRPSVVRSGLHRPRRRREPLRCPRRARVGRRTRLGAHAPALRARPTVPLPAGAVALARRHADPTGARPGRPTRRAPRSVAARARPLRDRVRLVSESRPLR
jgi:glycine/D-amino acid oxidase-like deaminating enzyme